MNAHTLLTYPQVAAAWAEFATKVVPNNPEEMRQATILASRENIDWREALDRIRGEAYAREECAQPVLAYENRRGE